MRMYTDLAAWYPLLTPLEEYEAEAAWYRAPLLGHLGAGRHQLLELGAGAGHNAHFLSADFDVTLVDLSPAMLEHAARNCPCSERIVGDMRTVRLGRTFDAVFIHDAIVYMLTEDDLRAALTTAWEHLRPGGVALFAPDAVADSYAPSDDCGGSDADGRGLRYLSWEWQREGQPDRCVVDYVLLGREGEGPMQVLGTDRHEEGLFTRATWLRLLREVGFEAERISQPYEDRELDFFVGRRP
jgi:SAM-dependent methyltransferase